MRLRSSHVRIRLTLWYLVMFGAVLAIYAACAAFLQYWQLERQFYNAEVQDLETAEGLLYFKPNGTLGLNEDYHNHPESVLLLDRMMEVLGSEGNVIYRNARLGNRELGGARLDDEGTKGYNERETRLSDGTRVLLVSHVHYLDGRPLLIRLAYATTQLRERMVQFIGLLFLALPFAMTAAGVAAFKVTQKALQPLEEMAGRAEQITANRLHDRLPVENPEDELGHVARVFNDLLGRLENSFEQLRRFTSDASHEMRTPLAALRSVGETSLQGKHSEEEYRDVIGSMLEEVNRLTHMVESLLTISRADSGELRLHMTTFSFLSLVREASLLVEVLAEEKEQKLTVHADSDPMIHADRLFLRQAVLNLLHNAVKYSPQRGAIEVWLGAEKSDSDKQSWAALEIEDNGPGIDEKDRVKVFNRFYRVDQGRTREAGGAGLGLAIAKWAVEIHGGEIGVRPGASGGSCFFIRLRRER